MFEPLQQLAPVIVPARSPALVSSTQLHQIKISKRIYHVNQTAEQAYILITHRHCPIEQQINIFKFIMSFRFAYNVVDFLSFLPLRLILPSPNSSLDLYAIPTLKQYGRYRLRK